MQKEDAAEPLISASFDKGVKFPFMQMNGRSEERNPVHLQGEGLWAAPNCMIELI